MKKIKFRNIGPVSESWLNDVGVHTLKDLKNSCRCHEKENISCVMAAFHIIICSIQNKNN
jgi:hypothetical protein